MCYRLVLQASAPWLAGAAGVSASVLSCRPCADNAGAAMGGNIAPMPHVQETNSIEVQS
jgi:hypothetical protein